MRGLGRHQGSGPTRTVAIDARRDSKILGIVRIKTQWPGRAPDDSRVALERVVPTHVLAAVLERDAVRGIQPFARVVVTNSQQNVQVRTDGNLVLGIEPTPTLGA